MASSKQQKLWLLPAGGAAMIGGLFCFVTLLVSSQFQMPQKPQRTSQIHSFPLLNRAALAYVPPSEDEEEEKPDVVYTFGIDINQVRNAAAANPNIIGWIRVPDTPINYPVVQAGDNDFYMDKDQNGNSSAAGAIFADWRCNLETSDNSLIYGHNRGDGSMFHAVKNYKDPEWGKSHLYFELATLNHRYLYRIISCNVISGESNSSFQYWRFFNMNREESHYYYDNIKQTSAAWYGGDTQVPHDSENRFLCLQTCNSGTSDGIRCCVFAELVGDGTYITQYSEQEGMPGYKLSAQDMTP